MNMCLPSGRKVVFGPEISEYCEVTCTLYELDESGNEIAGKFARYVKMRLLKIKGVECCGIPLIELYEMELWGPELTAAVVALLRSERKVSAANYIEELLLGTPKTLALADGGQLVGPIWLDRTELTTYGIKWSKAPDFSLFNLRLIILIISAKF